jgi:adenylate cyclase
MQELDKGAKHEPHHPLVRVFRSAVLFYRGDKEEAIEMMREVLSENPQMDGVRPLFAIYLAGAGKPDEAREQLSESALAISKADHDMAFWVGAAYARLGEKDFAFKWLERAVKLGNENKPWYENDASLDSLRDDPRFEELLNKMGNRS